MFEPNFEKLVYWIQEREDIRLKKEMGIRPPWTIDPTMQHTYFCNVHREDDKVTKYIRNAYSKFELQAMPEFNMLVARLVNKPRSLATMGWPFDQWMFSTQHQFKNVMNKKGAWGSAYIVSTNGRAMPKHEYISGMLTAALPALDAVAGCTTLAGAHASLQAVQGIGSFMSGQIIADLKNTKGHPLENAKDWWTWCSHGPGSLRGMGWLLNIEKCTPSEFYLQITTAKRRVELELNINEAHIRHMCMQDFQNCLCEYDKYMRVSTGTGRSKRKYPQGGK